MSQIPPTASPDVPVGILVSVRQSARPDPEPVATPPPKRKETRRTKKVLPWIKSGRHLLVFVAGLGGAWIILLTVLGLALGHWVPRETTPQPPIEIAAAPQATPAVLPAFVPPAPAAPVPQFAPALEIQANEPRELTLPPPPACEVCPKPEPAAEVVAAATRPREEVDVRPALKVTPAPAVRPVPAPAPKEAGPPKLAGTDIVFVNHPPDAFAQARQEKKLVFVIHLSGNFEDTGFT